MDVSLLAILGAAALLAVLVAAIALTKLHATQKELRQLRSDRDASLGQAKSELDAVEHKISAAQELAAGRLREKTEAETRLEEALKSISDLKDERDAAFSERNAAVLSKQEAEKTAALAEQAKVEMQKRMEDWETSKIESQQQAKAAMLTTATELSNKLLADHKRETEAAKKESEQLLKKTTEDLGRHFQTIVSSVATLNNQVQQTREHQETISRALSSPAGAGQYAQIGLENTLKAFGLEPGRDFLIQPSIEESDEDGRLRPDAIVFLPGATVLVIDSKASKFLMELAELEGTDKEEKAYKNLARTMNQHLKGLASKNYANAVMASYRNEGRGKAIKRTLNIMYLPNEGAIEKLKRADQSFEQKSVKAGIILASPTTLTALIGFARVEIDLGRQAANQEKIVESTKDLLESIGFLLGHTTNVGKSIKSAADHFAKLTRSVNRRLLPRARGLMALGVRPSQSKYLVKSLPTYHVVGTEDERVIDAEAEDITPAAELTDQSDKDV